MPNGVVAPRGEISVIVSPTLTRSELASRVPMAMPVLRCRSRRGVPTRTLSATSGSDLQVVLAHAAHEAAERLHAAIEAITWPSISGSACLTPGTSSSLLGDLVVVVEVALPIL